MPHELAGTSLIVTCSARLAGKLINPIHNNHTHHHRQRHQHHSSTLASQSESSSESASSAASLTPYHTNMSSITITSDTISIIEHGYVKKLMYIESQKPTHVESQWTTPVNSPLRSSFQSGHMHENLGNCQHGRDR